MEDLNRRVSYEFTGDDSGLMKVIDSAIKKLDTLQSKLNKVVARNPKGMSSQEALARVAAVTSALSTVDKIQERLSTVDAGAFSPAQAKLVKNSVAELTEISKQLGNAKSNSAITKEQLTGIGKRVDTIFKALKKANLPQVKDEVEEVGEAAEETAEATEKVTYNLHSWSGIWSAYKNGVIDLGQAIDAFRSKINAVIATLRLAIRLAKEVLSEAADYVESVNFLNAVVGHTNESIHDFVKLQAQAFGLNPTKINETAATFYSLGDALGFTHQQSRTLSEGLTQLAIDLSSLHNTTVEEETKRLRSAMAGNARAMMVYGVAVQDASIQEWLLSKGIDANMRTMSEANQAAARYAYMLEKTTSAQGDLARTLKAPANQYKVLKNQFDLLKQSLGGLVTYGILPLVYALNLVLQPLNAFLSAAVNLSKMGLSASVGDAASQMEDLSDATDEAVGGLTDLDEINIAAADKNVTAGVSDQFADMIKSYDNMAAVMNPLIQIAEKLGQTLEPVVRLLSIPGDALLNTITALSPLIEKMLWPLEKILEGVAWLLDKVVTPIISFIDTLTSNIWLLVGAFVALNLAQLAATGSLEGMTAVKIIQWFSTLTWKIWDNTVAMLANAAQAIRLKIAEAALALALWWSAAAWWQKAIAIIAAAGAAALVVGTIVMAATSSAKSQADSTLNSTPTVPAMATGGVVNAPTVALIGEGRYNEAVVPLGNSPQFSSMKESIADEVARKIAQRPGSSVQRSAGTPVILQVNGREFARAILPDMGNTIQQTGVRLS